MARTELNKVDHNILRYANCWEDGDWLLEALSPGKNAQILSIGSAGDNSFSLLTTQPAKLVCVDVNATQLALISLKKAAFKALLYSDFLEFLGFSKGEPVRHWEKVAGALEDKDRCFWQKRLKLIKKGLIYQGKFERYLLTFQERVLPWIHGSEKIEKLFATKPRSEQEQFYQNSWNNRRWRFFSRLFFSRKLLGWGRDPEFLRQVEGNVGARIKQRINLHLSSEEAQSNYFLQFMLRGHFRRALPHYARPENFEKIKANLNRLELFHGALEEYSGDGFTHANLSNIFEYLDRETFANNGRLLAKLMKSGGKIAYWNLMVKRDLAGSFPEYFGDENFRPGRADYGFFYESFKLNTRK